MHVGPSESSEGKGRGVKKGSAADEGTISRVVTEGWMSTQRKEERILDGLIRLFH